MDCLAPEAAACIGTGMLSTADRKPEVGRQFYLKVFLNIDN
jgi:hypothetical protein